MVFINIGKLRNYDKKTRFVEQLSVLRDGAHALKNKFWSAKWIFSKAEY